jgi:hypothetical protein
MIGFESEEVQLRKLRDRLRTMSDEELIQFGESLRNLCRVKRVSATPDNFEQQLKEARGSGGEDIPFLGVLAASLRV